MCPSPPSHADKKRLLAQRKLVWACAFVVVFMLAEWIGGIVAGSLAILSDAAHLFSDVLSFLLSIFALHVAQYPATTRLPFGYHRAEVLAAFVSVLILWQVTLGLIYSAIQRMIALHIRQVASCLR